MTVKHWLALVVLTLALTPSIAVAQDEVVYYHTDAIGSVRMITDASGAEIERYDFLPFGEPWSVPATPDVREFAGKERDPESGLDYFGARYYRAVSGRFTSVDPALNIEAALVDPQRWNRYSYALNNPLKLIDPDGRDAVLMVGPLQRSFYARAQAMRATISDWITGGEGSSFPRRIAAGAADLVLGGIMPASPEEAFWASLPMFGMANEASQLHHIATNKSLVSGWTARFEAIFSKAGMSLGDNSNIVRLEGHLGRHAQEYHQYVYDKLRGAVSGLRGEQYNRALSEALKEIREQLLSNPDMVRGKLPPR
jgi:RHS repeat-associated protein